MTCTKRVGYPYKDIYECIHIAVLWLQDVPYIQYVVPRHRRQHIYISGGVCVTRGGEGGCFGVYVYMYAIYILIQCVLHTRVGYEMDICRIIYYYYYYYDYIYEPLLYVYTPLVYSMFLTAYRTV